MKPGSRVVYSTVDGDLRKASDRGRKELAAKLVQLLEAEGYRPVLAGG